MIYTVLAFILCIGICIGLNRGKIAVFGATGRVGRLVVQTLIENGVSVKAMVRSEKKAMEVLDTSSNLLELATPNIRYVGDLENACSDVSQAIWCATGFTDRSSRFDKVVGLLRLKFNPQSTLDIQALRTLGEIFRDKPRTGLPQIVACSSAGVTRPQWDDAKKERFPGAADIPIVRLNPFNILDVKKEGEDALRSSLCDYAILRPTGLNDEWPSGRPVLSQGDLAVGRICRADVARLLVCLAQDPGATGKTVEALALPSLPYPTSFGDQLSRLSTDAQGTPSTAALDTTYALLQQMVPGETLKPQGLAMGQKYEELDDGREGQLGLRGEEVVPIGIE